MAGVIESVRRLLQDYNSVQRLCLCFVATVICSILSSSVSPVIWFLVAVAGSWTVTLSLNKLTFFIPERYVFSVFDFIDSIEYYVKRNLLHDKTVKRSNLFKDAMLTNRPEDTVDIRAPPEHEARTCVLYIVRDFIKSWYAEYISTENQPVEEAQEILEQLTLETCGRLKRVDVTALVNVVITRFQVHIADYSQAQEFLNQQPFFRSKRHTDKPQFRKVSSVTQVFKSQGKFHLAMQSEETEQEYLRSVVKFIMKMSFPKEAFKCDAARELLLEILTQNVVETLVDLMSDPFWLHKVMVLVLTDDEVELIETTCDEVNDSAPEEKEASCSNAQTQVEILISAQGDSCGDGDANQAPVSKLENSQEPEAAATEHLSEQHHNFTDTIDSCHSALAESVRPMFVIGDSDAFPPQTAENSETLLRAAPEGSSFSAANGSADRPSEDGTIVTAESSSVEASCSDAESPTAVKRKEIYRVRNQKWNPEDDEILPTPFTLFNDSSTYQETVDISNAEAEPRSVQSAPDLQGLKIDYGPDISGMDPNALIKETPRILFAGVHIPETETAREPGGASQYTLYCIEYVAWHFLTTIGRWTQQPGSVKRRFREFTTLHDRLLDHPVYSKSLRDVKGPNRWRVLPLGQLHERTVEGRRKFLEQYLQSLSKKEDVGTSFALKEFLAYEADTRIAFVKKASELPRLDKIIAKTFSGVMNKIASMPGAVYDADVATLADDTDKQVQRENQQAQAETDAANQEDQDDFDIEFDLWYPEEQEEAHNNIESILWKDTYLADSRAAHVLSEGDTSDSAECDFFDLVDFSATPRPEGDGCDQDSLDEISGLSDTEIPLTVKLLELAVQLADGREAWVCHDNALRVFKIILGKALDSLVSREIADLTSASECASHIIKLREVLWPNGQLDTADSVPVSEEQRAHTRSQARQALYNFFPAAVPVIVGLDDFNHCVDVVMQCIDHPRLNRSFALTLMDLLVEAVYPEIRSSSCQQQLINTSDTTNSDDSRLRSLSN